MTERIRSLLDGLRRGDYKSGRRHAAIEKPDAGSELKEYTEAFRRLVVTDEPFIPYGDAFGFSRGTDTRSTVLREEGNITPNYYRVITKGFDTISEEIRESVQKADSDEKREYGEAMLECIDIILRASDAHRELARASGNKRLCSALSKVPHGGAESFYEALVFIRLSIYFLRLGFVNHVGLGRFDQYMYPFYIRERERGATDEELLELIEEFFISLNRDTDLYSGVQQGDNGQSMMLGGFDKDGNGMYNELTRLCMQASLELSLIDPKINLRVGKRTPTDMYEFATLLTKQGLGFPQYCNDDVVIPGLIKLGYSHEDALGYTVAACWEFIIPGRGADIPNIAIMNFPLVVGRAIEKKLEHAESFDDLMCAVKDEIKSECAMLIERNHGIHPQKQPLPSIFMDGCIEALTDMWYGGTSYYNFGCHGTGIANATDALAAVRKTVFDDKSVTKKELLAALAANFDGYEPLRKLLRAAPKMGNNDDYADLISCEIMRTFSENMNGKDNGGGGIWRAGTGSAHEYHYSAKKCPATADGRRAYEPYSSSFSPSLDIKTDGLLSVIQSFTKYDMSEIINGGPLTVEIHDTVLRNDIGIKKTAALVKSYIDLGGHQLQLNAINRERLLDAREHPEKYPNLIVRVWGWSGYFAELDRPFRDHIIRRSEYSL